MSKKVHNVNEHRPVGGINNHDASINRGKIKRTEKLQTAKSVGIFAYSSTREHSNKKVWNEAENRERDWGETREARALCARKTLTPRFTDFFTDFAKKTDCFAVSKNSLTLFKELKF